MKTYFIRHKDKDPKTYETLLKENAIAIFFDELAWDKVFDATSKSPRSDYFTEEYSSKEGKGHARAYTSAIRLIDEIRSNGGYVFAEYGDAFLGNTQKGCILGKVEGHSAVVEMPGISPVALRLEPSSIRTILYSDYPVLLAIRPPYGTICCPQRATYSIVAEHLFESKTITPSTDLMHPQMAEQMCGEYLRAVSLRDNDPSYRLSYCYMQIGKTLATVDVAGRLQNGKRLYAQVKNGPISKDDEEKFNSFLGSDDVGVIFDTTRVASPSHGVYRLNIDDVFNYFLNNNPKMIADLLGMPDVFASTVQPLKKSA